MILLKSCASLYKYIWIFHYHEYQTYDILIHTCSHHCEVKNIIHINLWYIITLIWECFLKNIFCKVKLFVFLVNTKHELSKKRNTHFLQCWIALIISNNEKYKDIKIYYKYNNVILYTMWIQQKTKQYVQVTNKKANVCITYSFIFINLSTFSS